jgi:hypothetical protein
MADAKRGERVERGCEGEVAEPARPDAATGPPLGDRFLQRKVARRIAQRKAAGGARPAGDQSLHAAAARGTTGGATELPHLDAIQRSFGRHDISGVEAHRQGDEEIVRPADPRGVRRRGRALLDQPLSGGDSGTSGNRTKWYVGFPDVDYAHELGHQLGLKDEYIDATVPDRKDDKSPGVHNDNSIMGNYYSEGRGKAEAKLRHGETVGGEIGAATGVGFTVSKKR